MEVDFAQMTDRVLREEAEIENRLHEQKVLLREVHHRVKNNLQLISSIINMQMRQIDSPEGRLVLRRIQDRVARPRHDPPQPLPDRRRAPSAPTWCCARSRASSR